MVWIEEYKARGKKEKIFGKKGKKFRRHKREVKGGKEKNIRKKISCMEKGEEEERTS